jgi:rRNA maturation RNase YbeY
MYSNAATDVLAFDLAIDKHRAGCIEGDVIVGVDVAVALALSLHISIKEEIYRYVLHGVLHLAGYDDRTVLKKKIMWDRQEYLLEKLIK